VREEPYGDTMPYWFPQSQWQLPRRHCGSFHNPNSLRWSFVWIFIGPMNTWHKVDTSTGRWVLRTPLPDVPHPRRRPCLLLQLFSLNF
jgi:hypothetical protein